MGRCPYIKSWWNGCWMMVAKIHMGVKVFLFRRVRMINMNYKGSRTKMSCRTTSKRVEIMAFFFIITSLMGASEAKYEHQYFKNASKSCLDNATCIGNNVSNYSVARSCQCDVTCSIYGDCCHDSLYFKPSALAECIQVGNWNTRDEFRDSYYMVNKCPVSWSDEGTRLRCENYMDTIRQEPILGHPVTSRETNITYVNYHCARCNNDLKRSTMIRWKFAVTCGSKISLPLPDVETVLRDSTYEEGNWFKPKFANASYHTCVLYVWRPWELLRRCVKDIVTTCPKSWTNDTVRKQCEEYTSLVFFFSDTPYRNPHCASCNKIPVKNLDCTKEGLTIEHLFPILFDISDQSGNDVGVTKLCKNEYEAYDPFVKKCRHIHWSLTDCNENYSTCNLHNCSKWILKQGEFILNDNYSAIDLVSNKVYKTGSFEYRDDGYVQICAEYIVNAEKFRGPMVYVTFIGLGISMIFLVFHLIAFTINPALRNLSGKNLASLCISLLLAYGSFIIGQHLQIQGTACLITALVTYYGFLSSFSWLLVMSFDVWRTLRLSTVHLRVVSRETRWYVFMTYSALAWICIPGVIMTSALITELYSTDNVDYLPGFGKRECWFGNRKALLLFFGIPVGVILTVNVILFLSSAYMICATTMSPSKKSSSTNRDYRLFARLALLMGLTWTTGFIAGFLDLEPIWYIYIALNAFQGLYIFIAFTCTTRVRRGVVSQVSGATKSNSNNDEKEVSCWSWPINKSMNTQSTS